MPLKSQRMGHFFVWKIHRIWEFNFVLNITKEESRETFSQTVDKTPCVLKTQGIFFSKSVFLIVFLLISSQNKKIQGSSPSIGFSISPSSSDYGTQKSTKHFVGSSLVLLILYIAIRCFPCNPQILARSSLFVLDRFPSTTACAGSLPPAPCMLPTNGGWSPSSCSCSLSRSDSMRRIWARTMGSERTHLVGNLSE